MMSDSSDPCDLLHITPTAPPAPLLIYYLSFYLRSAVVPNGSPSSSIPLWSWDVLIDLTLTNNITNSMHYVTNSGKLIIHTDINRWQTRQACAHTQSKWTHVYLQFPQKYSNHNMPQSNETWHVAWNGGMHVIIAYCTIAQLADMSGCRLKKGVEKGSRGTLEGLYLRMKDAFIKKKVFREA